MIKGTAVRVEKRRVQYRSFKGFEEKCFSEDVGQLPFDVASVLMTLTIFTGHMSGF